MKKILHLISSPRGEVSYSIRLGRTIVSELRQRYPGSTLTEVDLTATPYPHMDGAVISALRGSDVPQNDESRRMSDEAVAQLLEADIVVIGVPLFNFGIPSTLKSWLDNVLRAGLTFRYGENGPEGLVTGRKVYIALASGGVYSEGPAAALDHATPYLKSVLGFMGITDVSVIRAEGTAMAHLQENALSKALEALEV